MTDHHVDPSATGEVVAHVAEHPSAPFERIKGAALWLVVLLAAGTVLFWRLDIHTPWEPPYLNLALQIAFVGVTSFLVAALALRGFLRAGSWPLLWLGGGALTYGLAVTFSSSLLQWANVNAAVTIYSLNALLAALLHLFGAFFLANGLIRRESRVARRAAALQVYLATLAVVCLITVATLQGFLPPFFVQGQGGTPWRQLWVAVAGLAFLLAGLFYLSQYRRNRVTFLYWYALGLVLNALVMAGTLLTTATGTPLSWFVRIAMLLGGLYLLVAVLVTVTEARARSLAPSEVLASFFGNGEANLKRLVDSIMDAVIVTDERLAITFWNQAAELTYGWPARNAIGRGADDVLHTGYASGTDEQRALAMLRDAGTWRGEVRQKHRDGREISVLATVSTLKDEAGRVVGAVAVNRDISARVALEGQLRQANVQLAAQAEALRVAAETLETRVQERTAELSRAKAELEAIFAGMPDGIIVANPQGLTRCNQAAMDGIGLDSLEEFNADTAGFAQKLHERYAETGELVPIGQAVTLLAMRGERLVQDIIVRHLKTGQDVIKRMAAAPIIVDGQIVGSVTTAVDITERVRLEHELHASREQLRKLSRRVVELQESERVHVADQLYNDEGQRLSAVLLTLRRLQRDEHGDPALAARLEETIAALDDILLDMHNLAVDLRPVSLDRLGLEPALRQCALDFERKSGVEVQVELGHLQGLRLPAKTQTSVFRIVQAALENAVRHGQARYITLTGSRHNEKIVVVVEDDGLGFDVDAAVRTGDLGLLGMRERAAAAGGKVTVESEPGQGTAVYIEIPIDREG